MEHCHRFVEDYQGMMAFGLDRETDEATLICYLQKFSDDELMKTIIKRFSDEELEETFQFITKMMKAHLSEQEYHKLFLKE